jgi:hypothetical protein
MRPVRSRSQGIPLKSVALLGCVLVPTAALGAVATLWGMGEIDLPFLNRGEQIPAGSVAVVVSAPMPNGKPIPAYTKLTRDHVWDAKKGRLACDYLPPEKITKEMIIDLNQILGRVLSHDKPPGYVFTEKDFLEKGTRSGLVGGIPAGKRSMTMDASKIDGLFGLQMGDHIDLIATYPIEMPKGGGDRLSGGLQAQAQIATMQKRARVRPLAEDAVLITPVTIREKPTISKSLSQGTKVRMIPVQEIQLAVDPEEVPPITEALATDVKIMAIARSGRPEETTLAKDTPGNDPLSDVNVIDAILGNKREHVALPVYNSQSPTAGRHPSTATAGRHHSGFRGAPTF